MPTRLLAGLFVLAPCAAAPQWPEPGGELNRRTAIGVDAPRTAPVERWRGGFDEVLCEPVVSEGVVYVVGREGASLRLVAHDVATGERLASTKATAEGFVHVSVSGATAVLTSADGLRSFQRRSGTFRKGRVIRGTLRSAASLVGGLAAVATDEGLSVIELRTGKTLLSAPACASKPLVHTVGDDEYLVCSTSAGTRTVDEPFGKTTSGTARFVTRLLIQEASSRKPAVKLLRQDLIRAQLTDEDQPPELTLVPGRRAGTSSYLIADARRVRTNGAGSLRYFFFDDRVVEPLPAAVRDICVVGSVVFGRDGAGTVALQRAYETAKAMLPPEKRPEGAVDGPISGAGGVLLLGNWALDLETTRILWVAENLHATGPLVPAADGVVVYRDVGGDLICAGDGRSVGSAPGGGTGPDDAGDPTAVPIPETPTLPGSGPAVILNDGRRIEGTLGETTGRTVEILIGDDDAGPLSIPTESISMIETADGVEVVGDAYAVVLAAQDALDRAFATDLAEAFGGYARRDLLAEARRVLAEIGERGYPADELRALEESLANRTESVKGNRDRQLEAARAREQEVRTAATERSIEVAEWALAAGLPLEASDLLYRAYALWPSAKLPVEWTKRLRGIARRFIPEAFPLAKRPRAAEKWLRWAHELSPAGGAFFDVSEMEGLGAPWTSGTLGVRTANLTLLSRTDDPEIVGACLRHGEGAVRALRRILDQPAAADRPPLEVRIHATRDDYLEEDLGGFQANPWSLGFYSPMHRASRFHVPEASTAFHQGRQLHEVVAHEITHQFIEERWTRAGGGVRRTPIVPGYWVVEGFARFIEDQSLEVGRRGAGFDDPTVQSVDSAAGLAEAGGGLPIDFLIRAPQMAFSKLPDEPIGQVPLRSSLLRITHTPRTAFYDQAGALVFFLMNRCGDEGRGRFLDALAAHYEGETEAEGWEALGFDSASALEGAFRAFLEQPGR